MIDPMPGSAVIRPPTTRRSVGTAVISRRSRSTRKARSTENASAAGASAMPTTMKSKMFQPSRKKAARCTIMRAVSSTTNTASTTRSIVSRIGPQRSIAAWLVSTPSVIALSTISAMMKRSVRGSLTIRRSNFIAVILDFSRGKFLAHKSR